jgi:hypothetical protein
MYEVWGSTGNHGGHKKFQSWDKALEFAEMFLRAMIRDLEKGVTVWKK